MSMFVRIPKEEAYLRMAVAMSQQNALLQCKNINDIHTVYLTLSPCIVCIRMLMNTTCQRIVFINEHRHPEPKEMWVNAGKEWIQYGL
jgi:deoxycytidylate deaminase